MHSISNISSVQRAALRLSVALVAWLAAVSPAMAQARDSALYAAAVAEQGAVLRTLERLVNIETGSTNAQGMAEMGAYLESELKSLGASVTRHPALAGSVGDNIVGRFTGKGQRRLLLMAHMDTVYPRGMLAKAPFRIEGNHAYGPGIADDKSGIAVILHALRLLKARGFDSYAEITVMFNTDEETSSFGSSELIQALARNSDAVFSFEPNGAEREVMILGTSGAATLTATFIGKAAHSGVNPEDGVNAMVEASDFVLRTLDLDNKAKSFRFNWTMGTGGQVHNVIPSKAVMEANLRYVRQEQIAEVMKELGARAAKPRLPGSNIELSMLIRRPAFVADAASRKLVDKAVSIYQEVGPALLLVPLTGGGTDAATAALSGKPVIESLGLPGAGYHSDKAEYVLIDAIPRRIYLASRMIMDFMSDK